MSNVLEVRVMIAGGDEESLAEVALREGGPLVPWHPSRLRTLLATGQRAAAAAAVRQLLIHLKTLKV